MGWMSDPQAWAAFASLAILEIVLGIDNIVFISILSGKLPPEQREKARRLGIGLALITRILLLFSITWIMSLSKPWFTVMNQEISGRDFILIAGGLFLIYKAVKEIHLKLEGAEHGQSTASASVGFAAVIAQILMVDIVFSLDSVITAVGMAKDIGIMIAAVVVSVAFMLAYAGPLARFVERHPTVKMLALAFLILIGVNLVAEGFGQHIEKGYTYFAMAFSVAVEMLNLRLKSRNAPKPVELHEPKMPAVEK
jgi:predicted tellurium resistance membrane protein TerC